MQPQPQIVTGGQHRVHLRGEVHQQPGELRERLWRIQLIQIIKNQRDAATSIGELRQHPIDHCRRIEIRGRCWRFRTAGGGGSVTDRVEQGKPELLGVVLIALHMEFGEPVPPPRTVCPRAQQTCLPAASRSRDDRDLPRRRAFQGNYKITPVDQPGSCWSRRQGPALISTPDTPSVGHAVLAPSLATRPAHVLSTTPEPRFCCTLIHAAPRSHPVRRCPRAANRLDPYSVSKAALVNLTASSISSCARTGSGRVAVALALRVSQWVRYRPGPRSARGWRTTDGRARPSRLSRRPA